MLMIKSKFYLIRGDDEPIYVGFTNRPIKKRFIEHKADKDFSGYEKVTIEKLEELDYEFTWDEGILYKNANEVSLREAQLVLEYGTQDSKYQKAIGGGQVWTWEKWFVSTNRDNPKFKGMSSSAIEEYIQSEHDISRYMGSFVNHMVDPVEVYMSNFVNHMVDPVEVYMSNFVNHMVDPVEQYMSNFVATMRDPVEVYMSNFVNHMVDPVEQYMSNFVATMKDPVEVYMGHFVGDMKDPVEQYMGSFVGNMKDPVEQYMINLVNHMHDPVEQYMSDFVGNMKERKK